MIDFIDASAILSGVATFMFLILSLGYLDLDYVITMIAFFGMFLIMCYLAEKHRERERAMGVRRFFKHLK